MQGGITFRGSADRRAVPRLPLRFDVRWRPYGTGPLRSAISIDISSNGMAMSCTCEKVQLGVLIEVQIILPAICGVLESGGVLGCVVEVTRVTQDTSRPQRIVAGRFCTRPRLLAMPCR